MKARFDVLVSMVVAMSTVPGAVGPVAAAPETGRSSARTVTAAWPQFQGSAAHQGYNPLETTLGVDNVSGLAVSWVGLVGDHLDWASPVVARGNVYITGGDSGLNVFPAAGCGAATCQPTWRGRTGPQAIAAPAVIGKLVFVSSQASFNSNDGRLSVFRSGGCGAAICHPLWQGMGGDESFLVSSPAIVGGLVYVASVDGKVYAFDAHGCGAAECPPLWTGQTGGAIDSSPAVAGGVVYVGSSDGNLYAFPAAGCGAATCSPLWQGPAGRAIDIASPAVADGVVVIGGGQYLFAFDASGCGAAVCAPLWKGRAELVSNTPAVAGGMVYIDAQPSLQGGGSIGVMEAFALHGCGAPTCRPAWIGRNFTNAPESSPVVANGVVYIGKGPATFLDSGVFAYDAAGCGHLICDPIAFAPTSDQQQFYLSSTPAVVDGRVYMGSTETDTDQAGLYVFELPAG